MIFLMTLKKINGMKWTDRKTIVGSYSTFEGSPASSVNSNLICGKLLQVICMIGQSLDSIKTYGLRNSLLLAPMPTASTSQILGYNDVLNRLPVIYITEEPLLENLYWLINI